MKNLGLLFFFVLIIALFSCQPDSITGDFNRPDSTLSQAENDRPIEPWAFRSVMDTLPRMLTLGLNDDLYVSYSTETGSLYKAWKGQINFTGTVYNTLHGPQPQALGDAWFVNSYETPFTLQKGGKELKHSFQYLGHRFSGNQVALQYQLVLEDGTSISIKEWPEYYKGASSIGFERIFETANVPEGISVLFNAHVNSVSDLSFIKTDGELTWTEESPVSQGDILAKKATGSLALNSNASTFFAIPFTSTPIIKDINANKVSESDEAEMIASRLIAKSDCKSCHNTYRKTIGPAYMEVAKRYGNTPENVAMLTQKVLSGGTGNWGSQIMNAHPALGAEKASIIVSYILSLDQDEEKEVGNNAASMSFKAISDFDRNDLLPGVLMEVYDVPVGTNKVPTAFIGKPKYAGISDKIDYAEGEFKDLESFFAIRVSGFLEVPSSDDYELSLITDDGSKLYINDELVINHDGPHGAKPKNAVVNLEAGFHKIKITFYQGQGGKVLNFKWKIKTDTEFASIPSIALSHNKTQQNQVAGYTLPMTEASQIPGSSRPVAGVHPSYDLTQARPDEFLPKVGGMDFLSDGRMVISTWDAAGSVFILENVASKDPSKIKVKTIATGLAEPLGLKVVNDEIYIMQKQELTKLVDHDGDEITDEYQTVCNAWGVTNNFHEFGFGLEYKDDHFYAALATDILPGGAGAKVQPKERGSAIKINAKTGKHEVIANGLRTPNGVGIGVDNEIFIADNQGDWLPASKIIHLKSDAWYGSRAVDFPGTEGKKETLPLVWLPQDEIGNSPSTPSYLNDGPYKGQMIHGEVTHGGVKRVFVEKVNGMYQGCVFRFIQGLEAGVNRLTWGPDGALYTGGIGSTGNWRHYGTLWYGLQRLAYNEKSTFEMLAVRAKSNGMEIEFTEPLKEGDGWNVSDYTINQWQYVPTADYGGPKVGLEKLNIKSANVSADRKKVFLELEGMKENRVIYVHLDKSFISENYQELWAKEAWYTLNYLPKDQMGTVASVKKAQTHNTLSESEKAAGWALLFDGKTTKGWRNFGKKTIGSAWIIEDGSITLDSKPNPDGGWQVKDGGDIITDGEYQNYEFSIEWKINACGNSGLIYNVIESDEYDYVWQTGPEMQVLDNTCHPDARIETHRAGDLYDMIACKFYTVKPAGEWNHAIIRIDNGKVEHWLNGYKVVAFEMWTPEWDAMVKASKFKDMPGFGTGRKGHISLQDHGDRVSYRNIKIKELK